MAKSNWRKIIDAAVAEEREACADVLFAWARNEGHSVGTSERIAAIIRARKIGKVDYGSDN